MPDVTPRGDRPPLWWKIVAGLLVLGFAIATAFFVEWRSAAPPPPSAPGIGQP